MVIYIRSCYKAMINDKKLAQEKWINKTEDNFLKSTVLIVSSI